MVELGYISSFIETSWEDLPDNDDDLNLYFEKLLKMAAKSGNLLNEARVIFIQGVNIQEEKERFRFFDYLRNWAAKHGNRFVVTLKAPSEYHDGNFVSFGKLGTKTVERLISFYFQSQDKEVIKSMTERIVNECKTNDDFNFQSFYNMLNLD